MRKVYILSIILPVLFTGFVNAQTKPGKVWSQSHLSETSLGFSLPSSSFFGSSIVSIGDFDGDGVEDFVVGAEGYNNTGAVWLFLMNADHSVKSRIHLSGSLTLSPGDYFGSSLAVIGDFDGDGVKDIAVGARGNNTGGNNFGAVYLLYLNANGTLKGSSIINESTIGFTAGDFVKNGNFGTSLAFMGERNLAVGANGFNNFKGLVWILKISPQGDVVSKTKISESEITGLSDFDAMGSSLAFIPARHENGTMTLLAGAPLSEENNKNGTGAIYQIFLNQDLSIESYSVINSSHPLLAGKLSDFDQFGNALCVPGDIDKNGFPDIIAGAYQSNDGQPSSGAVYVLLMKEDGQLAAVQKISSTEGDLQFGIPRNSQLGSALTPMTFPGPGGAPGFVVGLPNYNSTAINQGSIMLVNLHANITTDSITENRSIAARAWGTVNPHGLSTTIMMEYGTTIEYGQVSQHAIVAENSDQALGFLLTNLEPESTYHYRFRAENSRGISYGEDKTFTTGTYLFAGTGKPDDPFRIDNLADLQTLSLNSGYWEGHFIQTAHIDATDTQDWNDGAGFSPIGISTHLFKGSYDGQGFTISNLFIHRNNQNNNALFGNTWEATISNLGLTGVNIDGNNKTGSIAGAAYNTKISACFATGMVSGNDETGGLVGMADGSVIENCYSLTGVAWTGASQITSTAGFIGFSNGSTIKNSYSTGKVITSTKNAYNKGFIGTSTQGTYSGNYWDMKSSLQTDADDFSSATGRTSAEMKLRQTFSEWDFTAIWSMADQDKKTSYPYLSNVIQDPLPGITDTYIVTFGVEGENGDLKSITGATWLTSGIAIAQHTRITFEATPESNYFANWKLNNTVIPGEHSLLYIIDSLKYDVLMSTTFNLIVETWPSGTVTEGEPLSSAILTGAITGLPGGFGFVNPTQTLTPGVYDNIPLMFVPDDHQNYPPITQNITVTVELSNLVDELNRAGIKIFPNPARDQIFVTAQTTIQKVALHDISGRIIFSEQVKSTEFKLSMEGLEAGMYIIQVYTDHGTAVRKIQLQP